MQAIRRTKIVATLGPSTQDPAVLKSLIESGVDVVRLNFSHGSAESHFAQARLVRQTAKDCARSVAILADLQGPKIRIARFQEGKVELTVGASFILDANLATNEGDQNRVGIDFKTLPRDCKSGDMLLLDDGRIVLEVESVDDSCVFTRVRVGGPLSNNKGINLQGGGLSAPALTDKDKADIKLAAEMDVDYVAVSFPRKAADMDQARSLLTEAGGSACLVAKIERAELVASAEALDEIILASDAVMVARGDLGVEIGDAELVGVQKRIISRARALNRAVITATQMMESMISNPLPTRAEVMDVANAVLDGTDAVMLSTETAAGKYPVETVQSMARVILGAERERSIQRSSHRLDENFSQVDEALAMATMYTANHLQGVRAIVSMTESGAAPLKMSRISSGLPIFAFSAHSRTQRRVALYRGVSVVTFAEPLTVEELTIDRALSLLKEHGYIEAGDAVVLTHGDEHIPGGTNTMKIIRIS